MFRRDIAGRRTVGSLAALLTVAACSETAVSPVSPSPSIGAPESPAHINVGGKDCLVQRNWVNAGTGGCVLSY